MTVQSMPIKSLEGAARNLRCAAYLASAGTKKTASVEGARDLLSPVARHFVLGLREAERHRVPINRSGEVRINGDYAEVENAYQHATAQIERLITKATRRGTYTSSENPPPDSVMQLSLHLEEPLSALRRWAEIPRFGTLQTFESFFGAAEACLAVFDEAQRRGIETHHLEARSLTIGKKVGKTTAALNGVASALFDCGLNLAPERAAEQRARLDALFFEPPPEHLPDLAYDDRHLSCRPDRGVRVRRQPLEYLADLCLAPFRPSGG
ncbi:MAG: hypothetical protein AAF654_09190 [Myxococcota bacterium]